MTITPIQSTERAQVIAPATPVEASRATGPTPQEQAASSYYFSPVLKIDPQTQSVVIQYRNSETGVVTNQYPSEKELKAYASKQKFSDTELEPAASLSAGAAQPAATATVDAAAIKPVSTFNTATALPLTVPPAGIQPDPAARSIVI